MTNITRPQSHNPMIIHKIVDRLLPKALKWNDIDHEDDIQTTLYNALDLEGPNIYNVLRYLDDTGWNVDDELLDIFDVLPIYWVEAEREMIMTWVKENHIKPTFKLGDTIKIKHRNKVISGEIVRIDSKLAKYSIFVASLGHVRHGVGTNGIIVNYEDVITEQHDA